MTETPPGSAEAATERALSETRGFVRSSSAFFVGRLISVLINFLVSVLAVRYLAKSDYGALAWAQAIAAFGAQAILLGLNRGVSRYAAIHHERQEYGPMLGTIVLALGSVAGLGLVVVIVTLGLRSLLLEQVGDELAVGLLMILIALVPLNALDALSETLMAVLDEVRTIFFRRYVLGPGLKLAAVGIVIAAQGSPQMLAFGYVVGAMIGVAIYASLLWKALARRGLLAYARARLKLPVRTLFGFSLPVLSTDVLAGLETMMIVVLLERYWGTSDVAELQVSIQVAGLSLIVYQIAKILFKPAASRMYARGDESALGDLYWRSASLIAIATFPVFASSVFLADPIIVLLFGAEYRGAGILLAILAVGRYVNASMGMNIQTLQVHARVWLIVAVNITSAIAGLTLSFVLIPRFGAIGAAAAGAGAISLRNVLSQLALIATTRVGLVPARAVALYGTILAAVGGLGALRAVSDQPWVLVPSVAAASMLLLWVNRGYLDLAGTFPEMRRVPGMRHLVRPADEVGVEAS